MPDASLEQRVAGLEAKVAAIDEWLLLSPPRRAGLLLLSRRPPPSPEEQTAHEEMCRIMREEREAELAEFDRQREQERRAQGKSISG
jgi:hypothetical protein